LASFVFHGSYSFKTQNKMAFDAAAMADMLKKHLKQAFGVD